jgi:hypothetical protein
MPRGPKGEKRPADAIGNAVRVMQIATGEIEERLTLSNPLGSEELRAPLPELRS